MCAFGVVEQGKGAKDRYTLLSARLLEELRAYLRAYRPHGGWLFPTRGGQRPLDITTVQTIYTAAKLRARIAKRGGIHALRHNAESPIMPSSWPDTGNRAGSRHRASA